MEHRAFPFFDFGKISTIYKAVYVFDDFTGRRIMDLNKGDRDKTRTAKAAYGLCDKPFAI
jgi:hypothetical protein